MNAITKTTPQYSLAPTNFEEAERFANLVAKSSFCPKGYAGKPGDVLVAMQMGAELGLSPMQALQNVAVINGRPAVWGDAALAVCQNHPLWGGHVETEDATSATCVVTRKGEGPHAVTFTIQDAKTARLWGKQGPWTEYPKRMLQMRARSFALRDKFSDALKGMVTAEEAGDLPPIKATSRVVQSRVSEQQMIDDALNGAMTRPEAMTEMSPEAQRLQATIDAPIHPEEYVIQANGKNKGKALGELDDKALDWYAENSRDADLKQYAAAALQARRENVMQQKAVEFEEGTKNSWVAGDATLPEPGAGDEP